MKITKMLAVLAALALVTPALGQGWGGGYGVPEKQKKQKGGGGSYGGEKGQQRGEKQGGYGNQGGGYGGGGGGHERWERNRHHGDRVFHEGRWWRWSHEHRRYMNERY